MAEPVDLDLTEEWTKRADQTMSLLREHPVLYRLGMFWPFNRFFVLGYQCGHADGITEQWIRDELIKRSDENAAKLRMPPAPLKTEEVS